MAIAELTRIKEYKKNFHNELVESLAAIIKVIETKGEIRESNLNRAKNAAEGLRGIYKLEEDTTKERTLKLLLIYLRRKDLEKLEGELASLLEVIRGYKT